MEPNAREALSQAVRQAVETIFTAGDQALLQGLSRDALLVTLANESPISGALYAWGYRHATDNPRGTRGISGCVACGISRTATDDHHHCRLALAIHTRQCLRRDSTNSHDLLSWMVAGAVDRASPRHDSIFSLQRYTHLPMGSFGL